MHHSLDHARPVHGMLRTATCCLVSLNSLEAAAAAPHTYGFRAHHPTVCLTCSGGSAGSPPNAAACSVASSAVQPYMLDYAVLGLPLLPYGTAGPRSTVTVSTAREQRLQLHTWKAFVHRQKGTQISSQVRLWGPLHLSRLTYSSTLRFSSVCAVRGQLVGVRPPGLISQKMSVGQPAAL